MFKLHLKLLTGAALAGALLAGCGGGSDTAANEPPAMQVITNVADYVAHLIASAGENDQPRSINTLMLVADDTSEPAVVR